MLGARLFISVNLPAIVENWRTLQARVAGDCGAVVKADAYGLGMEKVASALFVAGCRCFFVTNLQEGIALRRVLISVSASSASGARVSIYLLQGIEEGCEAQAVQYGLAPVLISFPMALRWQQFIEARTPNADEPIPECAVKFNTGMNRLGLDASELDDLMARCSHVFAGSNTLIMTHLACADEPSHPLNADQLNAFEGVTRSIASRYPHIKTSMANSSGIFLGRNYQGDITRPGAALYGLNPTPAESNPMRNVLTLVLPILQLRNVPAGSFAGYGAEGHVEHDATLAVVAGGYADGILRAAFKRLKGWVNGHVVPIAGRVSMDTLIFDVTNVPNIEAAQSIEILGEHLAADDQGLASGTIGYELLTRLGNRVHRRYIALDEGSVVVGSVAGSAVGSVIDSAVNSVANDKGEK